jgi:outer membrane protein assembly factor BamB
MRNPIPAGGLSRHVLTLVIVAVALAGCKDGTGPRQEPVATIVVGNVPSGVLLSGGTVQLTATALDAAGTTLTNRTITWSTSDETIATVGTTGLVTAVGAGMVTITAAAEGKHGEAVLDVRGGGTVGPAGGTLSLLDGALTLVVPENALSHTITILARPAPGGPPNPRLVTGTTFEIGPENVSFLRDASLTIRYDDVKVPAGLGAWSLRLYVRSGDDWVPTRGSRVDQPTRTVHGDVARTGTYAVFSTAVDRIQIHGPLLDQAMYPGQVGEFSAVAFDTVGSVVWNPAIEWSSSSPTTVAIDATGKVTGGAVGTATITASVDGKSASTTVTVLPRPTPSWRQTEDWTTFQGNASRTGYVAATLDPMVFSQLWETTLGTASLGPPATGEGKVFVSISPFAGRQRLFALNAQSGSQLWSHDFGLISSLHPPAYGHGRVFVTTGGHGDSYLYGFDAGTGAIRFRSPYWNQSSRYFAPAVVDQRVYMAGGYSGGMYAVDAMDGEEVWFANTGSQVDLWAPAVSGGRVFAYTAVSLRVVDAASGAELYAIRDANFGPTYGSMRNTPVLGSLDNVLATNDGRIVSFDLANRAVGWERKEAFAGNVMVANGRIYVRNNNRIEARRESDGSLLWTWTPPLGTFPYYDSKVVTDNILFASAGTGTSPPWTTGTFAIDLETGKKVWWHRAEGELVLSAEGILYIAGRNGTLTAISVR